MKEYKYIEQLTQNIKDRMTGYVLVENQQKSPAESTKILRQSIQRFFGGFGTNVHLLNLGDYQFALLLPDILHKLDCVSLYQEDRDFAFIEGTFSDFDLLRKHKKQGEIINKTLAGEILNHSRNNNLEAIKKLNGRYSGFIYHAREGKLIVITDQYGANRIFVYNHINTFAISNNVFALSTNPHLIKTVDEESIEQILLAEYPFNRKTEFTEISLVLPSDIFIKHNNSISYQKYYQRVDYTRIKTNKQYIEDLKETINHYFAEFDKYNNETIGIYLSKGKDSRLFLPFLEQNNIPYIPFVFKDGTGIFDYKYVHELAKLLDKDLHVLENYEIDKRLALLTSMNTSPTMSWFALGHVAQKYTNSALMGLYGDPYAGKMPSFRYFGIKTKQQVAESFFEMVANGVTEEIVRKTIPYFNKFNTKANYLHLFDRYPESNNLFDYEIRHDIDQRSFRNALPILLRASHYITPVAPYMDAKVAMAYRQLPKSLINSQKAHTKIAALEKKTNKIQSTAFPISLKLESKIRPVLMWIIKMNYLMNNRLIAWHKRKFKPFVSSDTFNPRSDYFKQILKEQLPLKVEDKRLLTRMYNIDDYLHLTFHDDIIPLCKKPTIIIDQLPKTQ